MIPDNIALVGMPGCGKTVIGGLLAERIGYAFVDTDERIEREAGMKITEIFEKYGEAYFRDLEQRVITSAAAEQRVILSTGGGAVLRNENMDVLPYKVWIKRDLTACADHKERPLLADDPEKIYKLFEERKGLYERYTDLTVENDGTLEAAVNKILEGLK